MDISIAISRYLEKSNYQVKENEYINIVENSIAEWNLSVPLPTMEELEAYHAEAVTEKEKEDARKEKLQNGKRLKEKCDNALFLILNYCENMESIDTKVSLLINSLEKLNVKSARNILESLNNNELEEQFRNELLNEIA